jgi:hypothetical protein
MTRSIRRTLFLLPWSLMAIGTGFAQAPLHDPDHLPSFNGGVQQFTLTPRGEIDGVILSDGTEVKTPLPLSTSIAYSIKPGDAVTIHGLRSARRGDSLDSSRLHHGSDQRSNDCG